MPYNLQAGAISLSNVSLIIKWQKVGTARPRIVIKVSSAKRTPVKQQKEKLKPLYPSRATYSSLFRNIFSLEGRQACRTTCPLL